MFRMLSTLHYSVNKKNSTKQKITGNSLKEKAPGIIGTSVLLSQYKTFFPANRFYQCQYIWVFFFE